MGARFRLDQPPPHVQDQVAKQIYGDTHPDGKVPSPEPERCSGDGPLAAPQAKAGDPAKYLVRVKSYRTRLLDEDNLCPKWHIDSLRYAGILPADTPAVAHIEVFQEKVPHRADERTEITVSLQKQQKL